MTIPSTTAWTSASGGSKALAPRTCRPTSIPSLCLHDRDGRRQAIHLLASPGCHSFLAASHRAVPYNRLARWRGLGNRGRMDGTYLGIFIDTLVILTAAVVGASLAERLKLSSIVGYLAAGL